MAAPPTEAVPLHALDPGAGRRAKAGFAVFLFTLGVLAWQPWQSVEGTSTDRPSPHPRATDAVVGFDTTLLEVNRPTGPSRPFAPPRVAGLSPRWGVAAYLDATAVEAGDGQPASRELGLRTLPAVPSAGRFDDPHDWFRACGERAPLWEPLGAVIRSDGIRILGVTVPVEAARARITVRRIGERPLRVRQVAGRTRRLEAERIRPPFALFAQPHYRPWEQGIYRFDVHLPGGEFRYLYACVTA